MAGTTDRTSSIARSDSRSPVEQRSLRPALASRWQFVRIRGRRENCRLLRGIGFFLGLLFLSRSIFPPAALAPHAVSLDFDVWVRFPHGLHELLSVARLRVLRPRAGLARRSRGLAPGRRVFRVKFIRSPHRFLASADDCGLYDAVACVAALATADSSCGRNCLCRLYEILFRGP